MNQLTSQPQKDPSSELPSLYSKTLILLFAMLFSVLFAAILLIINLRQMGKKRPAVYVLLFTTAFLILTAGALQVFKLDPALTFVANVIGAAILNEFFWNKYIGKDTAYVKRNWIKPILISILIAMIFFFILLKMS